MLRVESLQSAPQVADGTIFAILDVARSKFALPPLLQAFHRNSQNPPSSSGIENWIIVERGERLRRFEFGVAGWQHKPQGFRPALVALGGRFILSGGFRWKYFASGSEALVR